ncbi:hypothetical protein EBT31_13480, partial [bacterium]|nr:hypothetical protein [bacterium]
SEDKDVARKVLNELEVLQAQRRAFFYEDIDEGPARARQSQHAVRLAGTHHPNPAELVNTKEDRLHVRKKLREYAKSRDILSPDYSKSLWPDPPQKPVGSMGVSAAGATLSDPKWGTRAGKVLRNVAIGAGTVGALGLGAYGIHRALEARKARQAAPAGTPTTSPAKPAPRVVPERYDSIGE